jgi:1-deoxyxylulose-5-phosphate synthase
MERRRLGNSNLLVSRLCLGCMSFGTPASRPWMLDAEASRPFFRRALDLGINFFDTANIYSHGVSEEITGRWLRDMAPRDQVVIATKVGVAGDKTPEQGGLSRRTILAEIDASLRRLGTDYVDLYQIHRFDKATPIEETLAALDEIVRQGKVRYLGASSMYAWQFAKMRALQERHGWAQFVSMQPQLNLVYREEEREMLPYCAAEGVAVLPWSPLARGFLCSERNAPGEGGTVRAQTDTRSPALLYFRPADFAVTAALGEVADELGTSRAQVALAWLFGHTAVTAPILGATHLQHLDEGAASLALQLAPEQRRRLEAAYVPKPVLDHD